MTHHCAPNYRRSLRSLSIADTRRFSFVNVKLGCVLSNSFGFGGTNASVVFKHVDA